MKMCWYVGTDRGVYVSLDRGESWEALQSGLPNVPVHDLVVHPTERELVAGTHGRSVWIVDVLPIQDLTIGASREGAPRFSGGTRESQPALAHQSVTLVRPTLGSPRNHLQRLV